MNFLKKNIDKTLTIFLLSHLVIWTLVPSLSNNNLPLDVIEAIAWSDGWPLGWEKHPPLSSWFPGFFFKIFGSQDWSYYLLSQIFVILAFFIVWKFSQDFLKNKYYSLISVLLLESIFFYNFTTPEFNVNVCQLPFWALTVYFAWKSYKEKKINQLILFGIFASMGFLSKYLFFYLLIGIIIFFWHIIIKDKKFNFNYLIPGIVFIIILTPHLIWLSENNYVTITYALNRTAIENSNFLDHFINPLIFLAKQIGILIPFFLMLMLLISKFKTKFNLRDKKLLFLLAVNIIPIILIFLTSFFSGAKIRTMWMTPFYLFAGVLLLYIFQNQIILKKIKYFFSLFIILFIFSPLVYLYVSITQTDKRTDYPGKEIAIEVQKKWDSNFTNTIKSVIGNEWEAGNLSYHLKSKPKWYSHSAAFVDKSINEFIETIGKDGLIIVNGECSYGISYKIKNKKICMHGNQ